MYTRASACAHTRRSGGRRVMCHSRMCVCDAHAATRDIDNECGTGGTVFLNTAASDRAPFENVPLKERR